jgi:dTDP-4-dehydrorhamnose reductase
MRTRALVFGATGLVASRLRELATECAFDAPTARVDITDREAVQSCLREMQPHVVVNAAADTDVTQAWRDAGQEDGPCFRVNAVGPENVATACEAAGVRLVHISTDYVFSGQSAEPYDECSPPDATDWYGFTKRVGEARALAASSACAVVRIASPFRARHARTDLARSILSNLAAGRTVSRFDDIVSMPTYVDDICAAIDHLASSRESGVFHVTNGEALSPHAFALLLARTWGYPEALLASSSHADYERAGHRPYPKHLVLGSRRLERSGFVMPSLQDALQRMHTSSIDA